jgi:hypothetical protein
MVRDAIGRDFYALNRCVYLPIRYFESLAYCSYRVCCCRFDFQERDATNALALGLWSCKIVNVCLEYLHHLLLPVRDGLLRFVGA